MEEEGYACRTNFSQHTKVHGVWGESIPGKILSQGQQNGTTLSFIAPSSEEYKGHKE